MSKYVIDTGPGYCAVSRVSSDLSLSFGLKTVREDWSDETVIRAWPEGETVALDTLDAHRDGVIESFTPYHAGGHGTKLNVPPEIIRRLGADEGDDVRLYERDGGGLCLVRSDTDPFVGEAAD